MSGISLFGQLSLIFEEALPEREDPYGKKIDESLTCVAPINQALYSLLGPMGHQLRGIFHRMQIAEDVITRMKRLNPLHADLIHHSFGLLYGTAVLEEAPDKLYVAHCGELIHRLIEQEDTRPATMAEILAAIRGVSLITPLRRHAIYLYWELFQLVFPEEAPDIFGGNAPVVADDWNRQQADELRAGLSARLTIADRVLKPLE